MPQAVDIAVIALNLLAGAGSAALLGVLTWMSWSLARSRPRRQDDIMRSARRRLTPAVWATVAVFVATAVYGELTSTSLGLPHAWECPTVTDHRAYALLALGGHLFTTQILVGLCALGRTRAARALLVHTRTPRSRVSAADLGAALVTTVCLAAALCALTAMAIVGYLQVLAHTYV